MSYRISIYCRNKPVIENHSADSAAEATTAVSKVVAALESAFGEDVGTLGKVSMWDLLGNDPHILTYRNGTWGVTANVEGIYKDRLSRAQAAIDLINLVRGEGSDAL